MIFLREIKWRSAGQAKPTSYPFSVPAIQGLTSLPFENQVTFFVGENGSGKSTLLEAVALLAGLPTVGATDATQDATLAPIQALADALRLVWNQKSKRGFFLRAEDFFGYTKRLATMRQELEEDLARVEREYADRSDYAKGLARMAAAQELGAMDRQYGRSSLQNYSHGESFLELFQSRLNPNGLYLLDEPEAPLSPSRQLTLLSLLKQAVAQNCQFIIATHSPILMAFPNATILTFDTVPPQPVPYDELEHVTLTRSFLANPESYLRYL